ncbi:hypothetical protein B8W95_13180, partial [Staphylococcus pasteuri]
ALQAQTPARVSPTSSASGASDDHRDRFDLVSARTDGETDPAAFARAAAAQASPGPQLALLDG